jgi:tRNA modification GTPase
MSATDLIAQVATAPGEAALAVLRVSGPGAHALLGRVFRSVSGAPAAMRVACLGTVVDPASGAEVDQVVVTAYPEGRSYTGEEMAEISCHGGQWAVRAVLGLLCSQGARPASPGEFTKRAYLSGRLDLAQAEAICGLIRAKSEAAARSALRQLHGDLTRRLEAPRAALIALAAEVEASLDYPGEDTGSLTGADVASRAAVLLEDLYALLAEAPVGRAVRDGITVALVGRPNTGKSSLLNRLLQRERAIVTDIPGTTRDTLEEWHDLGGVPVRLVDTAGLRSAPEDEVERLGLERTHAALAQADVTVAVFDASSELAEEDRALIDRLLGDRRLWVACLNKQDLPRVLPRQAFERPDLGCSAVVETCALTQDGADELRAALRGLVTGGAVAPSEVLLTSERHAHAVRLATDALERVVFGGPSGVPVDLLSMDLREAAEHLDEITGRATTEDVIETVFATFCLGK